MHNYPGVGTIIFWTLVAVAEGAAFVLLVLWLKSRFKETSQQITAQLNLRVDRIYGRRSEVTIIDRPGIEFIDVEKVLLSLAPKDADGRVVNEGDFMWEVIDQVLEPGEDGDVLTIEAADDGLSAWAISGAPGTCMVTVVDTAADIMERMPITIKHGLPSSLNLSAGVPVPETPVNP